MWGDTIDWGSVPAYLVGVGFVIGALGLNTWRRQMMGTHDFDLARQVLRATLQLRDAVQAVRHPFMSVAEAADQPADSDASWEGYAYQRRWDGVATADQALSVALLEVEVVWGDLLKSEAVELRGHVRSLNVVVRKFLRMRDTRPGHTTTEVLSREESEVLYWLGDDDAFSTRLLVLVSAIETNLAKKLGR